MDQSVFQYFRNFIIETEPLIMSLDKLSNETAAELYSMYNMASKVASLNIRAIDPELRVVLCDRQDKILERVSDFNLNLEHTEATGVFTPAVQGYRRWENVELLKDKGLTGYMLAGELGARPIMLFGTAPANYPYKEVMPGLEILYTDAKSGDCDTYFEHMGREYHKMDALVLHGMYNETVGYLDAYRKYRPDGKVYCGLDMNSYWMERVHWNSESAINFSRQCDVIATSCRFLRDALNRNPNVSFSCHWIPNGFFDPFNLAVIADEKVKKNIILTVGRIGTAQKNNEELLLAFEKIHERLPGWELRLVGSIEREFIPFIDEYFKAFPRLKNKVTFTGAILDKAALYKEYAQAKLFVLTSQLEGGTPNVYAEALVHGCMFVTSDIDAADDITNYGELGLQYTRGDVGGLAGSIVSLASNTDNKRLSTHISKAREYADRHFDWRRNAKKLAYMLYAPDQVTDD